MRQVILTVGPLVAGSATKIAASQTVPGAQGVVLNGSAGTVSAANVAASQSLSGAGPVTLINSSFVTGGPIGGLPTKTIGSGVWYPQLYVTSAGNDSGITFTIQGYNDALQVVSETITGSNTGVAGTKNRYCQLLKITASGATAGAITIGTFLPVVLDMPRQLSFVSGGDDSALKFTIKGLDADYNEVSEVLNGANGTAVSALDYLVVTKVTTSAGTASTLTVGTNGVAHSGWARLDEWAYPNVSGECVVSGTVNYTVQTSYDDPNGYAGPVVTPYAMTWDSAAAGIAGATATTNFSLSQSPLWFRTLLNSGTGSVTTSLIQNQVTPL